MSDGIHSCSYYCTRPACVLAQRDELRERYVAAPVEPTYAMVEAACIAYSQCIDAAESRHAAMVRSVPIAAALRAAMETKK